MSKTCLECSSRFESKSSQAKYCSPTCRNRANDRRRMIPCRICGEPMHRGSTVLSDGTAAHNKCRSGIDALSEGGEHNATRYRHGCRCKVCKAAISAKQREYTKRVNYYQRPEVKAKRQAWRSTDAGKAQLAAQRKAWTLANPDKASAQYRAAADRRRKAHRIPYNATQLLQRMSMFNACWICQGELGDDWHKDHVKPIARGGWDTLSNLRPAHATCNIRKGAKWPFVPTKVA